MFNRAEADRQWICQARLQIHILTFLFQLNPCPTFTLGEASLLKVVNGFETKCYQRTNVFLAMLKVLILKHCLSPFSLCYTNGWTD